MAHNAAIAAAVMVSAATVVAQTPAATGTTGTVPSASAALKDAAGRGVGEARMWQTPHGVLLRLTLKNATPGVHALHIHEAGRCDAPSFESAGGHFAAGRAQHGFYDAAGPHAGDLPNIYVPASTELTVEHHVANLTLAPGPGSLLDTNGSAVVIHAGRDDYTSDPAGAAGGRLACGVISRSGEQAVPPDRGSAN